MVIAKPLFIYSVKSWDREDCWILGLYSIICFDLWLGLVTQPKWLFLSLYPFKKLWLPVKRRCIKFKERKRHPAKMPPNSTCLSCQEWDFSKLTPWQRKHTVTHYQLFLPASSSKFQFVCSFSIHFTFCSCLCCCYRHPPEKGCLEKTAHLSWSSQGKRMGRTFFLKNKKTHTF